MSDIVTSSLDFEWRPVLQGAAVTAVCGTVAVLAFGRPGWLFPASVLGGATAGLRGGYYSQSATNGFVGVGLGLLAMLPALFAFRATYLTAFPRAGSGAVEFVFLGSIGAMADLALRGPMMLFLGYISGALVARVKTAPEASPRRG
ncbi:hypothetical protein [Salinarchaeum laminariae]|uniref:hypothetical protein n=1 Tax=Salinarchaeum laminariae TaxID=869888 RepID=UPI0020BD4E3E|nr:hypothetical protein [Salinarchaeum laminariae]